MAHPRPPPPPHADQDAIESAHAAKLRYVTDRKPGITRVRVEDGFDYYDVAGQKIIDPDVIQRFRKLAIPPAYTDVWICRDPRGHLQAVGRDARGRKQYRYHPNWRTVRDEAKYGKMLVFGQVLPRIREQVAHDMRVRGLPRRKVLAAIVALLEKTMMRVGNEEYAKENKSYGLTTLRVRHAQVKGSHVEFDFRGKHGVDHHIDLDDQRLARIVKQCRDLPGQDLFQFVDHDGERHSIGSEDVNEYLQEISGEAITAKDFRTWAATNLAATTLAELERFDTQAAAKKGVLLAVEGVAKRLGNTPAICRKCYIHPAVFEGYLDGSLAEGLKQRADDLLDHPKSGLTAQEVALTAFLSRRLGQAIDGPPMTSKAKLSDG